MDGTPRVQHNAFHERGRLCCCSTCCLSVCLSCALWACRLRGFGGRGLLEDLDDGRGRLRAREGVLAVEAEEGHA